MGIWEKVGPNKYRVNHFAWSDNDTTNPGGIGNPTGPTRVIEAVTLSEDGNSFQRHVFSERHRSRRKDDCLHRRHDHGDARHHGNDDQGFALKEGLVRG
jgi:hypothetical protein